MPAKLLQLCAVFFMGFSSGLPFALIGGTLQAWMTSEHIDLSMIGLFALAGLPYSLKPIWSPLLDRFQVPYLNDKLGRRKAWILVSQILLAGSILTMSLWPPGTHLVGLGIIAVATAFLSATQDIVIDAWRSELLQGDDVGPGASAAILGYRLGMLFSGALALILADIIPWQQVYQIMAVGMLATSFITFVAPDSKNKVQAPKTLFAAVVDPFRQYFSRPQAWEILLFILLYRLGDSMVSALRTSFLLQTGFSKTEIGSIDNAFGLVAGISGTALAGLILSRISLYTSLWVFGILQALSNVGFMVLNWTGPSIPTLLGVVTFENLTASLGATAYIAFLMSQCARRYSASQYALLTSVMAVTRTGATAPAGFLVNWLGWNQYFILTIVMAVPGILMILRFKKDTFSLRPSSEEIKDLAGQES